LSSKTCLTNAGWIGQILANTHSYNWVLPVGVRHAIDSQDVKSTSKKSFPTNFQQIKGNHTFCQQHPKTDCLSASEALRLSPSLPNGYGRVELESFHSCVWPFSCCSIREWTDYCSVDHKATMSLAKVEIRKQGPEDSKKSMETILATPSTLKKVEQFKEELRLLGLGSLSFLPQSARQNSLHRSFLMLSQCNMEKLHPTFQLAVMALMPLSPYYNILLDAKRVVSS
jgi:hypothetical protein